MQLTCLVWETLRQRIEHMSRIRDHQDYAMNTMVKASHHLLWPVQLESNTFEKRNRGQNKHVLSIGQTEYIRHLAISRLFSTTYRVSKPLGRLWN